MPRPERLLKLREQRQNVNTFEYEQDFSQSVDLLKKLRSFGRRRIDKKLVLSWLDGDQLQKEIVTKILLSYNPRELLKLFTKEELIVVFFKLTNYNLRSLLLETIFLHKDCKNIFLEIFRLKRDNGIYINDIFVRIMRNYLYSNIIPNFEKKHGQSEFELDRPEKVNPEYLVLGDKSRRIVDIEDYNQKTKKLTEISRILSKEFKSEFLGIVIYGSLYKGYSNSKSDIDYYLLSKDPKIAKRFKDLAKESKLQLCNAGLVFDPSVVPVTGLGILFKCLFFGDKKGLLDIQRNVFSRLDESTWDNIRKSELEDEFSFEKAFVRGNLGSRERRRILARVAMNALPDYETMKKQLGLN
jgi:predicted nucleotidyltransferase